MLPQDPKIKEQETHDKQKNREVMTTTRTEGKTDEPREQKDTNELLAMKVKAETLRNSQQQEDCYVHDKNRDKRTSLQTSNRKVMTTRTA